MISKAYQAHTVASLEREPGFEAMHTGGNLTCCMCTCSVDTELNRSQKSLYRLTIVLDPTYALLVMITTCSFFTWIDQINCMLIDASFN